jgi:heme exporter protein B
VIRYATDVATLARKDVRLELRTWQTLPAMLLFVVSTLVVFHFAVPGASDRAGLGLLWVALLFAALLGLARAFVAEREQRLLDALVLAPCDRSAIWLGKALAVLTFLVALELVALPAYGLFFGGLGGRTVAAVALADIGICAVGTLLSAIAAAARVRELLLPLLFLPLALPIVIGGVGASLAHGGRYLAFLALYDLLFATLCWGSFEYVVTE